MYLCTAHNRAFREACPECTPEPTPQELAELGTLHSAPPALFLEATPAGMQYSLVPPPPTVTRKGAVQGRLF